MWSFMSVCSRVVWISSAFVCSQKITKIKLNRQPQPETIKEGRIGKEAQSDYLHLLCYNTWFSLGSSTRKSLLNEWIRWRDTKMVRAWGMCLMRGSWRDWACTAWGWKDPGHLVAASGTSEGMELCSSQLRAAGGWKAMNRNWNKIGLVIRYNFSLRGHGWTSWS